MCFLTFLPKHQASLAPPCTHLAHVDPDKRKKGQKIDF